MNLCEPDLYGAFETQKKSVRLEKKYDLKCKNQFKNVKEKNMFDRI